jgi:hypothetical protein
VRRLADIDWQTIYFSRIYFLRRRAPPRSDEVESPDLYDSARCDDRASDARATAAFVAATVIVGESSCAHDAEEKGADSAACSDRGGL